MLCSFTVTTYLGMANGSEMQWPNWACSQKQPLSKTLLGIFTVMVRGYAAALLSSGLCLADNKTCSMYCKLGICCNTPSEADPLKTPGSVEVVGEAGVPCTAFATLLLSTASDCFGAASAAAALLAAAVQLAPLAAALLEDMCLHCQGRPPAVREEKKRLCFAALIEEDTELFSIPKRLL